MTELPSHIRTANWSCSPVKDFSLHVPSFEIEDYRTEFPGLWSHCLCRYGVHFLLPLIGLRGSKLPATSVSNWRCRVLNHLLHTCCLLFFNQLPKLDSNTAYQERLAYTTSDPWKLTSWFGIWLINKNFEMFIHDIRPTKCTNIFLRYLFYNITLNIPVSIRKWPSSGNQTKAVQRKTI